MRKCHLKIAVVVASAVVLMIQVKGVMNTEIEALELSKPETLRVKETAFLQEEPEEPEEPEETIQKLTPESEGLIWCMDSGSEEEPFSRMKISASWNLEGFVPVSIPENYARNGGEFPVIVQMYTYSLCKEKGISYPLIVSMIEYESGYRWYILGDSERSYGYMQIQPRYYQDVADQTGDGDLLNPYTNIATGITILEELFWKYGEVSDVLMVYNCGAGLASEFWDSGIYETEYTKEILERAAEIEEVIYENVGD